MMFLTVNLMSAIIVGIRRMWRDNRKGYMESGLSHLNLGIMFLDLVNRLFCKITLPYMKFIVQIKDLEV